jgi:hypothetical protein
MLSSEEFKALAGDGHEKKKPFYYIDDDVPVFELRHSGPEFLAGGPLDAPQMIPAGSMKAWDYPWGESKPYLSMSNREDDWAWFDDPITGQRLRIPYDALKYVANKLKQ